MKKSVRAVTPLRWAILLAALGFATLALSRAGDAQSSRQTPAAVAPSAHRTLTPLAIDPQGPEDPAVTFERWRRDNHVTIVAPRYVIQAHRKWLQLHRSASPSATATAPASPQSSKQSSSPRAVSANVSVGNNVDLDDVQDYQGEVAIAIDPANSNRLVAGANTFFTDPKCPAPGGASAETQALYGSTDGGATWTYACAPWPASLNQGRGPIFFGSDPAMAWDGVGNAFAAYMLISQDRSGRVTTTAIEVAKSGDSGVSWAPFGTVVNNLGNPLSVDDKDLMAVDTTSGQAHSFTNRIYVIWDENNTEEIASSQNGTFSAPVVLEDAADQGSDIGGDVAIAPDGTVNVIWNRLQFDTFGNQTGETTVFAASTDGGATFSAPATIATHNLFSFGSNDMIPAQDVRGINAFGALAADRSSAHPGNLYVVYADFASASAPATDTNIYMVRSTDGGASWSSALKLNDDAGAASQFFPSVAVDASSGEVVASWYDTRNNSPNFTRTQMYASASEDGGATFSPNQLVTSMSTDFTNTVAYSDENSSDNRNANPNQYGDYAQIAALGGAAHLIWTDSRMFFPSDTSNTVAEEATSAQISFSNSSATPTTTPSATPTQTPSATPTAAASPTPTQMPSATPTTIPSATPTQVPSASPTQMPTATTTATPSPTPTPIGPLRVRPRQLNFHTHRVGRTAGPAFARVTNPKKNSGDAIINRISLGALAGGATASDFQIDPTRSTCMVGMTLPPGKSCRVAILFDASSSGAQGDSLTIGDNASNSPQTVPLAGSGK